MLSFIYGVAGTGKSSYMYESAAKCEKAYVLVPEQYSMYAEKELIERFGLSVQKNVQIITFSRLANMIFAKYGPLRMRYVDKAGKYMLASRAVKNVRKKLTALLGGSHRRGFAGLITAVISEFKRYGVLPETLTDAANRCADGRLAAKLCDLALIYESYNKITAERFSDAEDNLALIIPRIGSSFITGKIFVSFFHSFTAMEYAALVELMKKADLCVSLCCDSLSDSGGVFSAQQRTYERLVRAARENNIEIGGVRRFENEVRHKENAQLLHLKQNLFAAAKKPMHGGIESVKILRPRGQYSEVTECARLILRLTREKGYSLNDFLVLSGETESYERIIPPIFEEFGIKYFLGTKMPITESPLMRAVISAAEIMAYGFSYERIMTLIRSGFTETIREDADMFENYLLAADITYGTFGSEDDWTYNPDARFFDMETVNEVRKKVVLPIGRLISGFSGRKTAAQICERFADWLMESGARKQLEKKITELKKSGSYEKAESLRLVHNGFIGVLGCMTQCLGGEYMTFRDFYETLTAACTELSVGMVPQTLDKVIISNIETFRSAGAKVVIILGASDGSFPKPPETSGLISDSEKAELQRLGVSLSPDCFEKSRESLFCVYSALTTASDCVYIFSPVSNSEGKALGIAGTVNDIRKKIFPDLKFTPLTDMNSPEAAEGREFAFGELSARLFESRRTNAPLGGVWQCAAEFFEEREDFKRRLKLLENSGGNEKTINKKTAEKIYGAPLVLSVSKLEKYNSCAYSFFMRYGLLARERLLGGFRANDMGAVLHSALQRYFETKTGDDFDFAAISRGECEREISDIIEEEALRSAQVLFENSAYYKYTVMRMKSIAARTAWKTVKFYAQSEFRPSGFEVRFGKGAELEPYTVEADCGKVFLEGFIDRVDAANIEGEKFISITDYKSSRKALDERLIDAGLSLQPLIYMSAAGRAFEGAEPAAMLYLHMNDPIVKASGSESEEAIMNLAENEIEADGLVLGEEKVLLALDKNCEDKKAVHYIPTDKKSRQSRAEIKKRTEAALKAAAVTADKIASGNIDAEPTRVAAVDPCSYCPYAQTCGKAQQNS